MRGLWADRRGSVVTFFALVLPVLVGVSAFAVDIPYWYYNKNRLQIAADAAALGAVMLVPDTTPALARATSLAAANVPPSFGKVASDSDVVFGTYDRIAKTFSPSASAINAVKVSTHRSTANGNPAPSFLGRIFNIASADINASSIAVAVGPKYCVIVLDPSASGAFSVGGGGTFSVPHCDVAVNSSSGSAAKASNNTTTIARSFCIVGSYTGGGFSPAPQTGCPAAVDPLATMPELAQPGACVSSSAIANTGTTLTLNPGTYCANINLSAGVTVLNPGNYYLKGLTLNLNTTSSISGQGVMLFLDADSHLSFNSSGTISLSAPTSGTYKGIVLFQSRTAVDVTNKLAGSANFLVDGTMYMPTSILSLYGSSTLANTSKAGYVIAKQLAYTGASTFTFDVYTAPAPGGMASFPTLVQ